MTGTGPETSNYGSLQFYFFAALEPAAPASAMDLECHRTMKAGGKLLLSGQFPLKLKKKSQWETGNLLSRTPTTQRLLSGVSRGQWK